MNIWWLAVTLGCLAACAIGFVWLVVALNGLRTGGGKRGIDPSHPYNKLAEEEVSHLFNKEFREELRNRGRLRFESIIEENAMFLKQDLDITTAQLNDYMKQQVSAKLDSEFEAYAKSMQDLQELAKTSLQQASGEVEKQRAEFVKTLENDVAERKQAMLEAYQQNMAAVVEHYLSLALADQFDLKAQLPYIIKKLEASKQEIVEDLKL